MFQILRPIPPIAFVPIVILWFGLSEDGKLFLVVWGVFFTVWLATHLGVQNADRGLIRAARCSARPTPDPVRTSSCPRLALHLVGLRTAVSISFYTLVAAELAGAFSGLAYRIDLAQQNMQTGQMLGGLAMLGIVSFVADRLFAVVANARYGGDEADACCDPSGTQACSAQLRPNRPGQPRTIISVDDLSIVFDPPQQVLPSIVSVRRGRRANSSASRSIRLRQVDGAECRRRP